MSEQNNSYSSVDKQSAPQTAEFSGKEFPSSTSEKIYSRRWFTLVILSSIQLLFVLDQTIVNVALPSIESSLEATSNQLTWVVNGYLVMAGGLLLLGGRLGDILGRQRMFTAGVFAFLAGSIVCGMAPNGNVLIAGRFFQGVGEALAAPAALALIALLFTDPDERAKAFGIWGGISGIGSTLGVLLSGILVQFVGWRLIFLINIPIIVVILILLPRYVMNKRAQSDTAVTKKPRIDWVGAVLVTCSSLLLIHGLLSFSDNSASLASGLLPIVIGVLGFAALCVVQSKVKDPLIPPRFFNNRGRVAANICTIFLASAMAAMFFLLTLFVQNILSYSPLESGLAYLPFCFAFGAGLGLGAFLINNIGPRYTVLLAFVLSAFGMALLAQLDQDSTFVINLLPATIVIALGLALGLPTLQNVAMQGLSEEDAGLGSGVQTTVQQLGSALGLALLVGVALERIGGGAQSVSGFHVAFLSAALVLALGAFISAILPNAQQARNDNVGEDA